MKPWSDMDLLERFGVSCAGISGCLTLFGDGHARYLGAALLVVLFGLWVWEISQPEKAPIAVPADPDIAEAAQEAKQRFHERGGL